MRMKSSPSSTSAPSLRNSVAIAAMRSVSLTRHDAMLRSVVVPLANSAAVASVIAASGIWLQSRSTATRPPSGARASIQFGPISISCAHFRQRLGKPHIPLDRIAPDALDAQRAATDRAERQKIGSRRGIALDINRSRRNVTTARRYRETLPALALHLHAEARHDRQRDFDIGPGNQLADDVDRNRLAGERQRHQQAGQELAGDIAAHLDRAARLESSPA